MRLKSQQLNILFVLLLVILLMLVGCAQDTTDDRATPPPEETDDEETDDVGDEDDFEVIEIDYATMNTPDNIIYQSMDLFKDLIEERSEGRVVINIHHSGSLGSQGEITESVNNGILHMAYSTGYLFGFYVPEFEVLGLPFIYTDEYQANAVVKGEVGDLLKQKLLDESNMRIVSLLAGGFRNMISSTPVNSLDDFRGLKFRSPESFAWVEMFKALGATPTPMPYPETYQALRTNLVDGAETFAMAMVQDKFYEVADYVIITQHMNTIEGPIINEQFYQSLPPDIQELIHSCMEEAQEWEFEQRVNLDSEMISELESRGLEIIWIDREPLIEATKSVWTLAEDEIPGATEIIEKITSFQP